MDSEYLQGIALINQAKFFEAHEVLEDIWRAAPPENKKFLQGLIQVAVAFHHFSTDNRVGMRSVMGRAIGNLAQPAGRFGQIHLAALLQSLEQWREALDNNSPFPPLPHIDQNIEPRG